MEVILAAQTTVVHEPEPTSPPPAEAPREWYQATMDRLSREEPWYTPGVAREIIGSL